MQDTSRGAEYHGQPSLGQQSTRYSQSINNQFSTTSVAFHTSRIVTGQQPGASQQLNYTRSLFQQMFSLVSQFHLILETTKLF
mmetsp:Transcript_20157/g.24992  ORF Transcript_20157/g.24992 Transcript_20157/m.24992 type:complete len:83 (-) Transcript_20157:194-442(-)